jgi:hypothetical protein
MACGNLDLIINEYKPGSLINTVLTAIFLTPCFRVSGKSIFLRPKPDFQGNSKSAKFIMYPSEHFVFFDDFALFL